MRFKTRLLGWYAVLCILVAGSVAALYYHYNKQLYKDAQYQMLQTSAEQFSSEFGLVLENMRFATNYVVGETELLDGLNLLVKNRNNVNCPRYFKQGALLDIKRVLARDILTKNFYSVRVFHMDGMMFAYDSVLDPLADYKTQVKELYEEVKIHRTEEDTVLLGRHMDGWGEQEEIPVISLVREILGYGGCYVEVQYSLEELERHLGLGGELRGLLITAEDGELLYCSEDLSEEQAEALRGVKDQKDLEAAGLGRPAAVCRSEANGVSIITVGDQNLQEQMYARIFWTSIAIALLTACILFAYVNLAAETLVRPVKKLQKIMEVTEYERMDQDVDFNSQIRELDDLAHSYDMLLKRLQKSMTRNKKMEQLYLQAQLENLQSKISPHFMANILNVISSRGLELGDREICQISSSMVSLLRYSTDAGSRDVRVSEELHHLKDYCYLMKSRYMEKFLYDIQIPRDLEKQVIPRLALQQIAENSMKHGFKDRTGVMEIKIRGWTEGEHWYIAVRDNGEGFERNRIETIYEKAEELKQQVLEKDRNIELALGGMGLVNLYLRMYFLYDEKMHFEIKNSSPGAEILIGGALREEEDS